MESEVLHQYVPISPNMISTDLFTPSQKGRATSPTIGVQAVKVRKPGDQSWGENITHYGGIGPLPFRGETRVRDLPVARSHRHYRSGLYRWQTSDQPTRLTSLLKSGCRLNDQVLPKPFDTPLDPAMKLKDAPTEGRPYTSHEPVFEVFPRNDPNRTDALGVSPLTEATRSVLNEINRDLYQTCKYQQTYPDLTNYIREIAEERSAKQKQLAIARQDYIKEKYSKMDDTRDALHDKDDEDDGMIAADEDPNEKGPTLKSILIKKQFCPIHDATPPKDGTPKPEKAGVTPCWPPSLSYTIDLKTAKLNEIDLQKFPPALRSAYNPVCCCRSFKPPKSVSFSNVNVTDTPMPTKGIIRPPTPFKDQNSSKDPDENESTKTGKLCKGTCLVTSDKKSNDTCLANACLNTTSGKLELPAMIDHIPPSEKTYRRIKVKELNGVQLPVPIDYFGSMVTENDAWGVLPFSASSPKDKPRERVVDKLGVRFKSAAHKRFHATHPDPLKDLRDARRDGKRYFFFGFHASAFRG